ncbi:LysR substrate-binding domain-containing protein, partial [Rhodococcus rhodnii]
QANRASMSSLLESGKATIGVAASAPWGPDIRSTVLFESRYACLYDPASIGHTGALTLDEYLALPHVMISADGTRGIVDDVLEADGLSRRRVASTAHFAMVPLLLRQVAGVATMPRHAAEVFAGHADLEVCDPPIAMPTFSLAALWHRTSGSDPRTVWMVRTLGELARTVTARGRSHSPTELPAALAPAELSPADITSGGTSS